MLIMIKKEKSEKAKLKSYFKPELFPDMNVINTLNCRF